MADLTGPRAKIKRAGEHLRRLKADTNALMQSRAYAMRAHIELQPGGWQSLVITAVAEKPEEEPPARLGVLVGDIAHNLRSALDHAVCALAVGSCSSTQFPICDSEKAWNIELDKGHLAGVGDRHRALINRVQPYNGRNVGFALRALRELSNEDKHRILAPMIAASPQRQPIFTPPDAVVAIDLPPMRWIAMKDGAEMMRFRVRLRPGVPQVEVDVSQPYTAVIGKGHPMPIANFFKMRNEVRRLVWRLANTPP